MKNKKGFTLIELLAVIIILGVLMIIAIPSVTKYINDSRKSGYVSTARSITTGVRNLINSGSLDLNDSDTTYYVDGECVKLDNGYKSPYADFDKAYVVVTATNDGHEYYWTSVDKTGTGVKTLKNVNSLESDDIEVDIDLNDIVTNIGIDGREYIVTITGEGCEKSGKLKASQIMNVSTGVISRACPAVSETIYWALQNPNSNNKYQKLILSDSPVTGGESGNFSGNTLFNDFNNYVPWKNSSSYINNIEIIGTVAPESTAYWFASLGNSQPTFNIDLRNLEVCNVTNMEEMFSRAGSDSDTFNLNISGWDTSKVEDMNGMFFYAAAYNPTTVSITGLSDFDVSSVTDTSNMFNYFGAKATTLSLNIPNWNLSHVTAATSMFSYIGYYSDALSLDLRNWNLSSLTDMHSMFYTAGNESQNITMNLSNWNTENATNMASMFNLVGFNSTNININLSGWDTSKVEDMSGMFTYIGNGENISSLYLNIGDWNFSSVTDMYRMFDSFGGNAQTFSVIIPRTNGNGINNATDKLYGANSNVYSGPPNSYSGLPNAIKPFTLSS